MTTRRTSGFGAGGPRLSGPFARQGRWRFARGFTLIELLVVIAIMIALTALVLPGMYSRAGSSSEEDVVDVVDAAVLQAKARSARTGQTAAVCMREEPDGSIRVLVTAGPGPSSIDGERASEQARAKDQTVGVIRQSKVRLAGSTEKAGVEGTDGREGASSDGGGSEGETMLAIMTPDGAVHPAQSSGVRLGDRGENHTVAVDGFGVVHVNRGQSSGVDGRGAEEGLDGTNGRGLDDREVTEVGEGEGGFVDPVTTGR